MVKLRINGLEVEVERGTSLLEAAQFVGFPIPTLCHEDGLTAYGACRMCLVEVGEAPKSKLVASCTFQAEDGLRVRTNSERVQRARKLLLELYVAVCPDSKLIQDLASQYGVTQCRFESKHENCIQCGLCVRMCEQQMMAGAISFANRGAKRHVSRPFDMTSELCRQCGACMFICPVCELRCHGSAADKTLCNGCLNFSPVCFQSYDDAMCFLDPCHACELPGPLRADVHVRISTEKSIAKQEPRR